MTPESLDWVSDSADGDSLTIPGIGDKLPTENNQVFIFSISLININEANEI